MRRVFFLTVLAGAGLLSLAVEFDQARARAGGSKSRPSNQRVVNKNTDLTISLAPEEHNSKPLLHVRLASPAEFTSFDEKGNRKPLTAAEKQKAKGPASEHSLPGYHGTTSDIKVGDIVTVSRFVTEKTDSKEKTTYPPDSSLSPVTGTVQSISKDEIVLRIPTPTVQSRYQSNPNGSGKTQAAHAKLPKEKKATLVVQDKATDKSSQPDKKNKNKGNNNN
jgi:hypothetical protein